jgi:hypothetical protein
MMAVRSTHIRWGKDGQISPTRHHIYKASSKPGFFDFLATFFGERAWVEDGHVHEAALGAHFVTTNKLPQLASQWIDQQRTSDEACSKKRSLKIKATMLFFSRMI